MNNEAMVFIGKMAKVSCGSGISTTGLSSMATTGTSTTTTTGLSEWPIVEAFLP